MSLWRWFLSLFRKRTPVPLPPAKDVPPDPPPVEPPRPPEDPPTPSDPTWPLIYRTSYDTGPAPTLLWNERGLAAVVNGSLRFRWPIGEKDDHAVGTQHIPFPKKLRQVDVTLVMQYSANWQGQKGGVNKINFLFCDGKLGSVFLCMHGEVRGPFYLRMFPQFAALPAGWLTANVRRDPVPIGKWFMVRMRVDISRPQTLTQFWLNGVLQGEHYGIAYPTDGFIDDRISPTWGGNDGDRKTQEDFIYIDDVTILGA